MRSPSKWARRGQRGQTLVEFALTIPILLVLTLGMLDIGMGVFYYNTLADCSREGARFGIVLTDPYYEDVVYGGSNPWTVPGNAPFTLYTGSTYVGTNTIAGKAVARASTLDRSQLTVYIQVASNPVQAHMRLPLRVQVEYPFRPVLGRLFGGATITLRGASQMVTQ